MSHFNGFFHVFVHLSRLHSAYPFSLYLMCYVNLFLVFSFPVIFLFYKDFIIYSDRSIPDTPTIFPGKSCRILRNFFHAYFFRFCWHCYRNVLDFTVYVPFTHDFFSKLFLLCQISVFFILSFVPDKSISIHSNYENKNSRPVSGWDWRLIFDWTLIICLPWQPVGRLWLPVLSLVRRGCLWVIMNCLW